MGVGSKAKAKKQSKIAKKFLLLRSASSEKSIVVGSGLNTILLLRQTSVSAKPDFCLSQFLLYHAWLNRITNQFRYWKVMDKGLLHLLFMNQPNYVLVVTMEDKSACGT
jgi:hypothetical protein